MVRNAQLHGRDCRGPHTLHSKDDHQRVAVQNGSKTAWGKSHASPSPQAGDTWEYLGPDDVIFGPYTLHHLQRWLEQRFLMADQQVRQVGEVSWVMLESALQLHTSQSGHRTDAAAYPPQAPQNSWVHKAVSNAPSAAHAGSQQWKPNYCSDADIQPRPQQAWDTAGSGWGSADSVPCPALPAAAQQQAGAVPKPAPVAACQQQQSQQQRYAAASSGNAQSRAGQARSNGRKHKSVGYVDERAWLYKQGGEVHGPLTGTQMRELLEDEAFLDSEVLVKKSDWKEYKPLDKVFDIIVQMYSLPPASSPPQKQQQQQQRVSAGSYATENGSSRHSSSAEDKPWAHSGVDIGDSSSSRIGAWRPPGQPISGPIVAGGSTSFEATMPATPPPAVDSMPAQQPVVAPTPAQRDSTAALTTPLPSAAPHQETALSSQLMSLSLTPSPTAAVPSPSMAGEAFHVAAPPAPAVAPSWPRTTRPYCPLLYNRQAPSQLSGTIAPSTAAAAQPPAGKAPPPGFSGAASEGQLRSAAAPWGPPGFTGAASEGQLRAVAAPWGPPGFTGAASEGQLCAAAAPWGPPGFTGAASEGQLRAAAAPLGPPGFTGAASEGQLRAAAAPLGPSYQVPAAPAPQPEAAAAQEPKPAFVSWSAAMAAKRAAAGAQLGAGSASRPAAGVQGGGQLQQPAGTWSSPNPARTAAEVPQPAAAAPAAMPLPIPLAGLLDTFFPAEKKPAPQAASSAAAKRSVTASGPTCAACGINTSVNLFIPCGHYGHCSDCLPDSLSAEAKLSQVPNCLVCGMAASRYMRVWH